MSPEDVCPTERRNRLIVNLTGGYCLLYPADFAPDPEFPVAIIGGPELGPVEGFDSLRASLAISSYGLGDQSPEQALQPISEQVDHTSVMTSTIGGYPAVIFDFIGGPWRQRNARFWWAMWCIPSSANRGMPRNSRKRCLTSSGCGRK